jgi:hypothetical protein
MKRTSPKVRDLDQEKRPEDELNEGEERPDDLVFNGGREFIFEDDSYLNFDIEEAENDNNPAFVFLAKIFDKEGARGLHLNNMDVSGKVTRLEMNTSKT